MRPSTPQWIGIALLALVLPTLTVTAWPLVAPLVDRMPEGLPVGRLALAVALGAAVVAALFLLRDYLPRIDLDRARLGWLIAGSWAIALGAVAVMALLVWFVLGLPGLQPPTSLTPRDMDAIATRAFAIVAGLGGVALLVISFRRQRATEHAEHRAERAAEREVSKLFTDTFDSASEKLGSEHPAVRLAGVHALARLADEAPDERDDLVQMVIDVLCAYLRMPYTPAPDPLPKNASKDRREEQHKNKLNFAALREVRLTIIRVIRDRLSEDSRWKGKNYDFTNVAFDGGSFENAVFSGGMVSFEKAEFSSSQVDFTGVKFIDTKVNFSAKFTGGVVNFLEAEFIESLVYFSGADFSSGSVRFIGAKFKSGIVSFSRALFAGSSVDFGAAEFTGSKVLFNSIFAGGAVEFVASDMKGGTVDFGRARFSGGTINFDGRFTEMHTGRDELLRAHVSGGVVNFKNAKFKGSRLNLGAKFINREVDFTDAEFSGGTLDFRTASGFCPWGLSPASSTEILLPDEWTKLPDEWGKMADDE